MNAREREERIRHQCDPSVWTRDYAERQKQKTLEIIGKIEREENKNDTEGVS